jgi:hypothetical protein
MDMGMLGAHGHRGLMLLLPRGIAEGLLCVSLRALGGIHAFTSPKAYADILDSAAMSRLFCWLITFHVRVRQWLSGHGDTSAGRPHLHVPA